MNASAHSLPERCPDENALASFASGALSGPNASSVETHLDGCADCRALVAAVAAEHSATDAMSLQTRLDTGVPTQLDTGESLPPPVLEGPPLRPGEVLGRFVISGVLGAGGMGVVYAAEDPQLGRKVALKLLRSARADATEERQARLLREAQAMARLSHPNVLPVFDLGTEGGQVFLAMELVEGPTLAEWLRQRERPWREVVELFLEAGRGLAAAHRAGLVHRDFKPANVLVGRDGRPRVTDFGLVRVGASGEEVVAEAAAGGSELALTQAGAVPGTPAYMSPEQLAGRPVDARGDQFSFCVALYEALYGLRPFAAEAPPERRWTLRRPERGPRLPRQVKAALARGLALEVEDRFPSMDALLAVLARPPLLRGRWWALSLAAGLALAGVAVGTQREFADALSVDDLVPLSLAVDETSALEVPGVSRVAVEEPGIVDIVADGEQLHLVGLTPGATRLMVWTKDKQRHDFLVTVMGHPAPASR
ncbi:protein kinase domain-containing protein [Hyalangium rubrum]|uniref:Protein kinase n=1 Tax=Hyalangium rubrum TaxID=3103134 RepID=A0ABU5HFB5_9BACT|nr:protein kinase [Hyalangium sp. s54d21]MDY7232143.1 protein kinase [Hyalangium sp. s54d21]